MNAKSETPEARAALTHVRRAVERAGQLPGLPPDEAEWRPLRAAVVGAGTMGVGITEALVTAGVPVTLVDRTEADVARGLRRLDAIHASSVRRGRLDQAVADERRSLVTGAAELTAVAGADLVIEAVFEELSLKREVFAGLDRHAAPGTLLGTNTSFLDIDVIAEATGRPEDVVGTHFFSPAQVMKLLEVVPGARTSPRTVARVMALARRMGKVAVRAGNANGFIGNAMMEDYLREAWFLVEEGALPADVDRVLTEFGLAMGPFAMTDMAGHDIGVESRRREIATRPTGRRYSDIALHLVDLGRLGQKSGAGWYRYEAGDRTPHPDPEVERLLAEHSARIGIERRSIGDEEILQRTMFALVNRAAWLLGDGIAAKPGDIDVVYTTGYGFPAWRGGPLYWADSVGLPTVLATVDKLHGGHDAWWEPAPVLKQLVADGSTFGELDDKGPSA